LTIGQTASDSPALPVSLSAPPVWVVPRRAKELFVAFAFLCLFSFGGLTAKRRLGSALESALGNVDADILSPEPAPLIALPARGGGDFVLQSLAGKLVLVNFWASWCAPCRAEEPSLDKLAGLYDPATFEVVAVSVDDDWAAVEGFFGKKQPNYRVALDVGSGTSLRYGTSKFPESYLVDARGRLKLKFVGPRDWMDPAVSTLLEELGAKRKAP
jgi:thiol-disulfide isomerase/thioredoxin